MDEHRRARRVAVGGVTGGIDRVEFGVFQHELGTGARVPQPDGPAICQRPNPDVAGACGGQGIDAAVQSDVVDEKIDARGGANRLQRRGSARDPQRRQRGARADRAHRHGAAGAAAVGGGVDGQGARAVHGGCAEIDQSRSGTAAGRIRVDGDVGSEHDLRDAGKTHTRVGHPDVAVQQQDATVQGQVRRRRGSADRPERDVAGPAATVRGGVDGQGEAPVDGHRPEGHRAGTAAAADLVGVQCHVRDEAHRARRRKIERAAAGRDVVVQDQARRLDAQAACACGGADGHGSRRGQEHVAVAVDAGQRPSREIDIGDGDVAVDADVIVVRAGRRTDLQAAGAQRDRRARRADAEAARHVAVQRRARRRDQRRGGAADRIAGPVLEIEERMPGAGVDVRDGQVAAGEPGAAESPVGQLEFDIAVRAAPGRVDRHAVGHRDHGAAVRGAVQGIRVRLVAPDVEAAAQPHVGVDDHAAAGVQRQPEIAGVRRRVDDAVDRDVVGGLQGDVGEIEPADEIARHDPGGEAGIVGILVDLARYRRLEIGARIGVRDDDVGRVEQPGAGQAGGRRCVDAAGHRQPAKAGGLDLAAVAALGAAARRDGAVEAGAVVGPQHDRAPVAGQGRVGGDAGAGRHFGAGRAPDLALALPVAADQRGAAAGLAGDVDIGGLAQPDVLAEHMDRAARLAGIVARRVQRPADRHGAGIATAEHDGAGGLGHRARLDDAAHVDDLVDDALGRRGGDLDAAAVGVDGTGLLDRRQGALGQLPRQFLGQGQVEQAVAVEVEGERRARGQPHRAEIGRDDAAVDDVRRHETGQGAFGHADGALVDDRRDGAARALVEHVAAGQEVLVADVVGRRHQPGDVDDGVPAEHDAVGIDQPHLAVGREVAEDRRRIAADHPVERDRRRRRLHEPGVFAGADRERIPVDDRLVAALADFQLPRRRRRDPRLAGRHHPALGIGQRRRHRHAQASDQGRTGEKVAAGGTAERAGHGLGSWIRTRSGG